MVWRIWHADKATLRELQEWYSLDDVMDANDVLDYVAEAERQAATPHGNDGR